MKKLVYILASISFLLLIYTALAFDGDIITARQALYNLIIIAILGAPMMIYENIIEE